MDGTTRPSEFNAHQVAARYVGHEQFTVARYPTGLCHYVYEVIPTEGPKFVVRMGHDETRAHLEGSVFWAKQLEGLEIPTARILRHDLNAPFPYTILEHLPGVDIGGVIGTLTPAVRRSVALSVAVIQDRVAELPHAGAFGYGHSYQDPRLKSSWRLILDEQLERARQWIRSAAVAPESHVDRVADALHEVDGYLKDIEPRPFLHDTTTKNVLVNDRGLVGIVDIDDLCFGDRLYVLSLTNMAILSSRSPSDYIEFWSDAWKLSATQRGVVRLYTAIHCVGFIGELGQRFNKDVVEVDYERLRYLEEVLDGLLR